MRKLKNILLLLTTTLVIGTGASFAYWFFDTATTGEKDAIQDIRTDNIFENYASIQQDLDAKKISDTEYEIYIFPSNEYLRIYEEYLANPAVNPKPEDFNGYLEPILNDDGTVKTDAEGKVFYETNLNTVDDNYVHIEHRNSPDAANWTYPADNYVKRIQDKYTVRVHNDNLYKGSGSQFYTTNDAIYTLSDDSIVMKSDNRNTYYNGEAIANGDSFYINNGYYSKLDNYAILHSDGYTRNHYDLYEWFATHTNTLPNGYSKTYRTYGEPGEKAFRERDGILNTQLDADYRSLFPQYVLDWENKPDEHKPLYSSDRFGYWQDLTMQEGRFKPIKLTIRNSISPQLFDQCHGRIGTSVGDGAPNIWFEPEFSGFTFAYERNGQVVKPLQTGNFKNYLIDQTVYPRDLACSYDMDLVFDISKSLSMYADDDNVVRLFPTFASNKSYYGQTLYNDRTLNATQSLPYGTKDALRLETTITDTTNNEQEFRKIYPPYTNHVAYISQPTNYGTREVRVHYGFANNIPINIKNKKGNLTKSHVQLKMAINGAGNPGSWGGEWPVIIDLDFSKPDIINQLNGPGYYNFFIFVGNSGTGNTNVSPINEIYNNLGEFYNYFPDLYSKKMFVVHDEANRLYCDGGYKPILLLAQKATEPKMYQDVDQNYSFERTNKLVIKKHDTANTAFEMYRPIYEKQGEQYNRIYTQPGHANKTNPTTFMFKGVDFTNALTNTFQIRYGNVYNHKIGFTTDATKMYEKVYMPTDPSKSLPGSSPAEEIEFKRALGPGGADFFNIKSIQVPETDEPGAPLVTMDVFELKDDSCRGIYDIMFAMNEDLQYHPNGKDVMFDVYVYRHTNIFIKLFDQKLTKTITKTDPNTGETGVFINHDELKEPSDPNCYWRKRFYIGDVIDDVEISEIPYNGIYYDFEQAFLEIGQKLGIQKEDVIVVDQVTDAPIAWYVKDEYGNLILTFNKSFKVLKNYIFYVSDKDTVASTEW